MKRHGRGGQLAFSLIELLVTITILAILVGIAAPSFKTWLLNKQVRTAADSIVNGMQKARGEAVSRNANVAFQLGVGTSWTVSVVNPATVIESRLSAEGSSNVVPTVSPGGATSVTFNSLGSVVSNADASPSLTQVDLEVSGGTARLRVTVGVGGNVKMCDRDASPTSVLAC